MALDTPSFEDPEETIQKPKSPLSTEEISIKPLSMFSKNPRKGDPNAGIWTEESDEDNPGRDSELHPPLDQGNRASEGADTALDEFDPEVVFEEDTTG